MIITAEPLGVLRQRTSEKWTTYPDDVLPLFVAEMDYPLAQPIIDELVHRVRSHDIGYVGSRDRLAAAFESFAAERWNWIVDPARIRTTTDVSVAIVETFRQSIRPGDRVVITPPVYPPFFELIPEAGGIVVEVPLLAGGLDLGGIEAAFAAGARGILLCNPHNPLGLAHSRESLRELAELAARFDAVVVSDEIHAPLARTEFTPFLSVSDAASQQGITVTSASKAFNVAGAKCALIIAGSARGVELMDAMPAEVAWRTSQLGLHANAAAFELCGEWLDAANVAIATSAALLESLLAEHLPGVRYVQPDASYLAWLDFRSLDWGDDPSVRALAAGVALNSGPTFGAQGRGFARLNLACSSEVLSDAIARMSRAAHE